MARGYDPRMHEEHNRVGGMLYVLMLVIALAFGGFVWQIYSGPAAPHIAAPSEPYKITPPPNAANAPDEAEQNAFFNSLDGHENNNAAATPRPGPEVAGATSSPVSAPAQTGVPQLAAAPSFVASGSFVAQLAALQSEAAVQAAWTRLSSRAPNLFGQAHLDVQRADLGQRGIYFRVRAGYFADRANASRFCDRIRQMGQDCIPVAR
ncbi:MAG: SPOR domain-containing protein [Vitreimonas sp.]